MGLPKPHVGQPCQRAIFSITKIYRRKVTLHRTYLQACCPGYTDARRWYVLPVMSCRSDHANLNKKYKPAEDDDNFGLLS